MEIMAEIIRPARPGNRNSSAKNLSVANLAVFIASTSSQARFPDGTGGGTEKDIAFQSVEQIPRHVPPSNRHTGAKFPFPATRAAGLWPLESDAGTAIGTSGFQTLH
jgi:hypothetical protein